MFAKVMTFVRYLKQLISDTNETTNPQVQGCMIEILRLCKMHKNAMILIFIYDIIMTYLKMSVFWVYTPKYIEWKENWRQKYYVYHCTPID